MFYYVIVFPKIAAFSEKNGKKPFLGPKSFLKGKGTSGDKNEYNLFYGK